MSQLSSTQVLPGCCVLLEDVDWKTYTRLLRALAERPSIRLTYDRGRLEIMSRPLAREYRGVPQSALGNRVLLQDIDWRTYTRLLRILDERPRLRLTYDRGELEIMSPTLEHDDDGEILGEFVAILVEELDLPLKRGGTVTLRRRRKQRGIESDKCFWIANAHRMEGKRRLNLRRDPPPDLAMEVDVTRSSAHRVPIYASLRVPELWRLDGDTLTFHVLQSDGDYTTATHSLAFPMVTSADLMGFLQLARLAANETVVMRQFRAWVRQQVSGGSTPTP